MALDWSGSVPDEQAFTGHLPILPFEDRFLRKPYRCEVLDESTCFETLANIVMIVREALFDNRSLCESSIASSRAVSLHCHATNANLDSQMSISAVVYGDCQFITRNTAIRYMGQVKQDPDHLGMMHIGGRTETPHSDGF